MSGEQNISALLEDSGIRIGDSIVIYPKYRKISVKNNPLDLTAMEFKLMLLLVENVNKPVDAETIYQNIWNDGELKFTSDSLKMHISNIRHKLKNVSDDEIQITHVRNKGYCLVIPQF